MEVKNKFRKDRIEFDDAERKIIFARKIFHRCECRILVAPASRRRFGFCWQQKDRRRDAGATRQHIYGIALR
jgi:hypothetical protein